MNAFMVFIFGVDKLNVGGILKLLETIYYFKISHNFTKQNSLHAFRRRAYFYVVFVDISFVNNCDSRVGTCDSCIVTDKRESYGVYGVDGKS